LKRLAFYFRNLKPTNQTYEDIYEGKMYELGEESDPTVHNQALYWNGEIGYEITKSNRLELSKPTVVIHIPMKLFGVEKAGTAGLDYIFRSFIPYVNALNEANDNRKRTHKENGHYYIYEPSHKVLSRNVITTRIIAQKYYKNLSGTTIVPIDNEKDVPAFLCASIMIQVQLPAGKHLKAGQMLAHDLPEAVNCFVNEFDRQKMEKAEKLYEKQEAIRAWLKDSPYCAFVANGSILPRAKGGDNPLEGAVPFLSTAEDEVEVAGIRGMAFQKGITVITGGGYSGKSTLLDALDAGIYNHVAGDGREYVITDYDAMKISAEDGRCIRHANLSPFIKWLPEGSPWDFSTEHASGSTSQAANIMEAIGWGARLLMIDEDKSATNFMIQDFVMKALIDKEPITPFVERVRELAQEKNVSTILVIGGSSEYLQAADRIYMMRDYQIVQVTKEAKSLQAMYLPHSEAACSDENKKLNEPADFSFQDKIDANLLNTRPEGSASEMLKVSDLGFILLGNEQVDIRMIHDIVTIPQLNAIAFLLRRLMERLNPLDRFQKFFAPNGETAPRWICREEEVEKLLKEIETAGLDTAHSPFFTECGRWMDLPRKYEILAVLSRMKLK
jgi:hypothetical protein